jgi:DNA topoisomerase-3
MTLQIAQALYEKHKALTYPANGLALSAGGPRLHAQRVMSSFEDRTLAAHADKALQQGWVRPNKRIFNDAKVSDHFAIVPDWHRSRRTSARPSRRSSRWSRGASSRCSIPRRSSR